MKRKTKRLVREIGRISASDSPRVKATLNAAYGKLLDHASSVLDRAKSLENRAQMVASARSATSEIIFLSSQLTLWLALTVQVCDTAHRRTQLGEKIAHDEKLFSLFETHTQLYRRGKARQPNQFGRMALIFEDGAGFISHYQRGKLSVCDKCH